MSASRSPPQHRRSSSAAPRPSIDWFALLQNAISEPGIVSAAYHAFWNYSIGNQLIALFECHRRGIAAGPIHTFNGWIKLGRHVRKGEKAIELCMPVSWREKRNCSEGPPTTGDPVAPPPEEIVRRRFVFKPHWFVIAQTDGTDVPADPIPEWSADRALVSLDVVEVPFDLTDGNVQGFARERSIAVSPIAYQPHRTRFHELAHVVLGHTDHSVWTDTDARMPRDVREVEAEAVAYLCICCLGLDGQAFSRGYLQHWLTLVPQSGPDKAIPEKSVHRIFRAADQILKAGRPDATSHESPASDPA